MADTATASPETGASVDSERERSSISFPYNDLDNGVRVAKAVHRIGGSTCQRDQLAAELRVSAAGGGFSLLLLTAKIFGLITYGQGTVQLTALGQRINDPKQERGAKAEAFLVVPLYKAIYERFKGATLPPANALESEMANLGVAKKQTDKARQTFQRSAKQGGFFEYGQDRLVLPAAGAPVKEQSDTDGRPDESKPPNGDSGGGNDGGRHPFIAGLLKELPTEGDEWPTDERRKWLQAAAMIFDLIYKNGGSGKSLKIEVESAK